MFTYKECFKDISLFLDEADKYQVTDMVFPMVEGRLQDFLKDADQIDPDSMAEMFRIFKRSPNPQKAAKAWLARPRDMEVEFVGEKPLAMHSFLLSGYSSYFKRLINGNPLSKKISLHLPIERPDLAIVLLKGLETGRFDMPSQSDEGKRIKDLYILMDYAITFDLEKFAFPFIRCELLSELSKVDWVKYSNNVPYPFADSIIRLAVKLFSLADLPKEVWQLISWQPKDLQLEFEADRPCYQISSTVLCAFSMFFDKMLSPSLPTMETLDFKSGKRIVFHRERPDLLEAILTAIQTNKISLPQKDSFHEMLQDLATLIQYSKEYDLYNAIGPLIEEKLLEELNQENCFSSYMFSTVQGFEELKARSSSLFAKQAVREEIRKAFQQLIPLVEEGFNCDDILENASLRNLSLNKIE